MTDILDPADLGPLGPKIGSGGQGVVYELAHHPGWAYKRYRDDIPVDVDGLRSLVEWGEALDGGDRKVVFGRAAWPVAPVHRGDETGVVMSLAPQRFLHVVEGERVPRDLQFAYNRSASFVGVDLATPRAALTVTYRIAQLLQVMHRQGAAYGDLSQMNVFWSVHPVRPAVFLIDCDSAWVTNSPRGLPSAQTPMWDDPWPCDQTPGGEVRRDCYKLALLFLRLYYHSHASLTKDVSELAMRPDPPLTPRVARLLEAGLASDPYRRPTAEQWLEPLVALDKRLRAAAIA